MADERPSLFRSARRERRPIASWRNQNAWNHRNAHGPPGVERERRGHARRLEEQGRVGLATLQSEKPAARKPRFPNQPRPRCGGRRSSECQRGPLSVRSRRLSYLRKTGPGKKRSLIAESTLGRSVRASVSRYL